MLRRSLLHWKSDTSPPLSRCILIPNKKSLPLSRWRRFPFDFVKHFGWLQTSKNNHKNSSSMRIKRKSLNQLCHTIISYQSKERNYPLEHRSSIGLRNFIVSQQNEKHKTPTNFTWRRPTDVEYAECLWYTVYDAYVATWKITLQDTRLLYILVYLFRSYATERSHEILIHTNIARRRA